MRRKSNLLTAATIMLLCMILAVGCSKKPEDSNTIHSEPPLVSETESSPLSSLQENIRKKDCILGIAFIGYVDSESTVENIRSYLKNSSCASAYPFLSDCEITIHEGAELYAFVPGNQSSTVTVYKADASESGEYIDYKDVPLYQGKPGENIVLRCNLSEIHANVLISVTDGTETLEFHPMLSMMDGHVVAEPGCYDFTDYEMTEEERAQDASDLLTATDEVKDALERGMKLLYTGDTQTIEGRPCLLFALVTDREDQFVREQLYAVSDNLIYVFDTETDQWQVLGAE